jgi:hypothetical protein
MAIKAPSRVETPKVGTGPLNGANTATLTGPLAAPAPPQAVKTILARISMESNAYVRLIILPPPKHNGCLILSRKSGFDVFADKANMSTPPPLNADLDKNPFSKKPEKTSLGVLFSLGSKMAKYQKRQPND